MFNIEACKVHQESSTGYWEKKPRASDRIFSSRFLAGCFFRKVRLMHHDRAASNRYARQPGYGRRRRQGLPDDKHRNLLEKYVNFNLLCLPPGEWLFLKPAKPGKGRRQHTRPSGNTERDRLLSQSRHTGRSKSEIKRAYFEAH
jgi:hypothetical protein